MSDWIYGSARENRTTTPGRLLSGRYRRPHGYKVKRSRGTKDFYLTFTLQGKGVFHNGQDSCECPQGDITLITPGTPHYYGTPENTIWEFYWCHFVPKEEWVPLLQLPEAIKGIRWARFSGNKESLRLRRAFRSLLHYNEEANAFAEKLAVNALEEILLLISKNSRTGRTELSMDPRVEQVIELISRQFYRPYRVSDLAALVNLSPSRFTHLFKLQTGESVMDMLNKIRLQQGRKLLETTSKSIAEIAEEVGYNHSFYFSRQFAAFYGKPPALFRKYGFSNRDE
ncbi:helix-turn-helix domain-containing protein [Paenibacillus rigui]|uniref:AraC family transcriptional regulator n=1 Tax=Paenibacillus rigui TaxID=554312 RepID=A0A229UPW9_9BACL|nr:helix-turn-helix domain-containing protein [Paenibacillus rigui]OXM85468.1 AraC family transcriptional regulator [Paenibacillus rigui]